MYVLQFMIGIFGRQFNFAVFEINIFFFLFFLLFLLFIKHLESWAYFYYYYF